MSTKSVVPSNRLILCCPLLLLPSIFPSLRVFSNESVLCIRAPKYWSFSISPSSEYSGLISMGSWGWQLVGWGASVFHVASFSSRIVRDSLPGKKKICLPCWSPGFNLWDWEDPLEKGMATHSSILACRIPWTEELGRLQSVGSPSRIHLSD